MDITNENKIGNQIRMMRNQLCMTRKTLAQEAHVSQNTIYRWENGLAIPSYGHWIILCHIFHLPVHNPVEIQEFPNPVPDKEFQTILLKQLDLCPDCRRKVQKALQQWYTLKDKKFKNN